MEAKTIIEHVGNAVGGDNCHPVSDSIVQALELGLESNFIAPDNTDIHTAMRCVVGRLNSWLQTAIARKSAKANDLSLEIDDARKALWVPKVEAELRDWLNELEHYFGPVARALHDE